jgi:hypothetical protein
MVKKCMLLTTDQLPLVAKSSRSRTGWGMTEDLDIDLEEEAEANE